MKQPTFLDCSQYVAGMLNIIKVVKAQRTRHQIIRAMRWIRDGNPRKYKLNKWAFVPSKA